MSPGLSHRHLNTSGGGYSAQDAAAMNMSLNSSGYSGVAIPSPIQYRPHTPGGGDGRGDTPHSAYYMTPGMTEGSGRPGSPGGGIRHAQTTHGVERSALKHGAAGEGHSPSFNDSPSFDPTGHDEGRIHRSVTEYSQYSRPSHSPQGRYHSERSERHHGDSLHSDGGGIEGGAYPSYPSPSPPQSARGPGPRGGGEGGGAASHVTGVPPPTLWGRGKEPTPATPPATPSPPTCTDTPAAPPAQPPWARGR